MRTLPTTMIQALAPFAPLFSKRVWHHAQTLLAGAILAPGRRTVASALRAVGLEHERRFCRYHRVLSRAAWSGREVSRVLLGLLVEAFVPEGPLVLGVDETLERRRGKKISAKGIYRDPVRSSREHFVKTSALRWVCLTLLTPVPWASRVWSLPFLRALAYSERYAQERGKRHKRLTEWAWQMLLLVRRWYPEREIVAVADGGYASLKLLDRCRQALRSPITFITRLAPGRGSVRTGSATIPRQIGRTRLKGERLANLSAVPEDPKTTWTSITVLRMVRWEGTHGRDGFRHGGLVLHGAAARSVALGPDPRSRGGVRDSGLAVHRSPRRPRADHRLVREALADGDHFSRGSPAPGLRDSEALVRAGGPKDRSRAVGAVLRGCVTRPPAKGADPKGRKAGGMVREGASDLL